MVIGIVGSEAKKFTTLTEAKARQAIRDLLLAEAPELVVSGHCHLGGIDIWAIEEAIGLKIPTHEFPPATLSWEAGYKPRNIQIANLSDLVVCVTVAKLPPGYTGMKFPYCYHCGTTDHVKSGGCWTVKYARRNRREGRVIVI